MSKGIKKVIFITGTRADFGKLKPLINKLEKSALFEVYIFATGMHTLARYGSTIIEVLNEGYKNTYAFNNQVIDINTDAYLAKNINFSSYYLHKTIARTIEGFSEYVQIVKPDMVVVHGDRSESLAASIVGAISNIPVVHIEGGEVSGTIDESMRHAITKMSHLHFVANHESKKRVIQLGEKSKNVYVIGSPDVDVMKSNNLPTLSRAKKKYDINFGEYAVFIYHPVTTELEKLEGNIKVVIKALIESNKQYIVVYPNNDPGSGFILKHLEKLEGNQNFRIFPSLRFEFFLAFLKNAKFIVGNSSAGIREAGYYKLPCIDIGSRQKNRSRRKGLIKVSHDKKQILDAITKVEKIKMEKDVTFGRGDSSERFFKLLKSKKIWNIDTQKQFVDIRQ